jgi:hypothetical protein
MANWMMNTTTLNLKVSFFKEINAFYLMKKLSFPAMY